MISKRAFISCVAVISLFISILTPITRAQRLVFDDWTAVQALTPGDEVIVTLKTEKELKGKFLDAGAGEVSLERKGKRESVAKDTIAQLHVVKGKAAKGKWALIGAGAGAGAGFAIGQSKNGRNVDDGETYVFAGTLIGTGIGAVTGYLFGASRRDRQLVYRGH